MTGDFNALHECQAQIDVIVDLLEQRRVYREMVSISLALLYEERQESARLKRRLAALHEQRHPTPKPPPLNHGYVRDILRWLAEQRQHELVPV